MARAFLECRQKRLSYLSCCTLSSTFSIVELFLRLWHNISGYFIGGANMIIDEKRITKMRQLEERSPLSVFMID